MQQKFDINEMLSTFGNTFYPTGHVMVLMKYPEELGELEKEIKLIRGTDYYVFSPEEIISKIGPTVKDNDEPLPSVGTEGAAVRGYIDLAKDGYGALLIEFNDDNKDFVTEALEQFDNYVAKYYRMLVIEDISRPSTMPVGDNPDIVKENIADIVK